MLKKYYAGLAVVLLFALYVSNQYQGHTKSTAQQSTQLPDGSVSKAHDNHATENTKNAEWNPPRWFRLFTWPEGVTTWAIMLTLLAIAEQTNETAKSAKASRDSIRLQEIALQQWVALVNWQCTSIRLEEPEAGRKCFRAHIRVELVNQSSFPLTISDSHITFSKMGRESTSRTSWGFNNIFLPPHCPHLIDTPVDITDGQASSFPGLGFGVRVDGKFIYTSVLGKTVEQMVEGILVCRETEVRFLPDVPMHPQKAEPESQNPN